MFFGIGIIGVLSSYLSTTFISLEQRRKERIEGGKENNVKENTQDDDDSTSRDAELAAIRQELAELRSCLKSTTRNDKSQAVIELIGRLFDVAPQLR